MAPTYSCQMVALKDGAVVTLISDKPFPYTYPDGTLWDGTILEIYPETAEEYKKRRLLNA